MDHFPLRYVSHNQRVNHVKPPLMRQLHGLSWGRRCQAILKGVFSENLAFSNATWDIIGKRLTKTWRKQFWVKTKHNFSHFLYFGGEIPIFLVQNRFHSIFSPVNSSPFRCINPLQDRSRGRGRPRSVGAAFPKGHFQRSSILEWWFSMGKPWENGGLMGFNGI